MFYRRTAGLTGACLAAFVLRMRGGLEKRFCVNSCASRDWILQDNPDQVSLRDSALFARLMRQLVERSRLIL